MGRTWMLAACVTGVTSLGALAGTQEGTDVSPIATVTVKADPAIVNPGDEVDQMAAAVKPLARFAGYTPAFRVETRTFKFAHYNKENPSGVRIETDKLPIVLDGEKVVAVLRSGDIMLVARTPESASAKVGLPTERLHLDNLPGPSLPTWQFIKNVKTHGSIYADLGDKVEPKERWEKGPATLSLVREQTLPEYTTVCRYTFSVDPVYGYRLDAVRDVDFAKKPEGKDAQVGGGAFTPGCYNPWPELRVYERTAWTPISGGISGWANNSVCQDRCDDLDRKNFAWRDGGFITYMPSRDGWSPAFTRKDGLGDTPPLQVCNAHNDFHIKFSLKDLTADGGRYKLHQVNRLVSLPPEMTAKVWDGMDLILKNEKSVIIGLGAVQDFEDQPVPLSKGYRGMAWTGGEPKVVEGVAHSGSKSLLIKGRSWPNLPQVSLKPGMKYRLEGWYKVTPWTKEQLAEAKAAEAKKREELKAKNKPLPEATDWDHAEAKAYIRGDFYEWSPYDGPILQVNKTNDATGKTTEWQHVAWDFTAPEWGPFINVAFHADFCEAYLDDFALREIPANEQAAK